MDRRKGSVLLPPPCLMEPSEAAVFLDSGIVSLGIWALQPLEA